ncbi:MAG: MEDS domain-containing protein [Streptosporangiaceae bacterium]
MTVSSDAQITDLAVNDHACLTFGDPEELLDLTAAYVRDGLSGGLKVVWLSDAAPELAIAELARRGIAAESALAAGQITAMACENYILSGQTFAAGHAVSWLNEQVTACREQGFPGIRVALDMSWALRPIAGVEQLPDFEEAVGTVLTDEAASLLCQYDRERFDPVTLASVAGLHGKSVAAATYHADAMLRICRQYAPTGIRLAGEIDYHAEEPLALALAEALRLDGDITINMADLAFIDVPCVRMIVNLAKSLPPSRKAILRCQPVIADRFAAFGATDISNVSLVIVDDR